MWIASKIGFFSIVVKETTDSYVRNVHIRARERADLDALRDLLGIRAREIEEWPSADYRWRIRIPVTAETQVECLSSIFECLSTTINYDNFKSAIAAEPAQRHKLPAYHRIWAEMARLQE